MSSLPDDEDDRVNITEVWETRRAAVLAELDAAKRNRIEVLMRCELFVERRAAEGDEEAAALAELAEDSRRRQETARLEGQAFLPSVEPAQTDE